MAVALNVAITTSQHSAASRPPATVLCDMPNARIRSFLLELRQHLQRAEIADDFEVVAVRVNEYDVEVIGSESPQRFMDAAARVFRREIPARRSGLEDLADFRAQHPLVAPPGQQLAEAFLADAVSRRGVDQIHADVARGCQQLR